MVKHTKYNLMNKQQLILCPYRSRRRRDRATTSRSLELQQGN